jgi:hypothetical protein
MAAHHSAPEWRLHCVDAAHSEGARGSLVRTRGPKWYLEPCLHSIQRIHGQQRRCLPQPAPEIRAIQLLEQPCILRLDGGDSSFRATARQQKRHPV